MANTNSKTASDSAPEIHTTASGTGNIMRVALTIRTDITETRESGARIKLIRKHPVFHFAVKTPERLVFLRATDAQLFARLSEEQDEVIFTAMQNDQSGELEIKSFENATLAHLALSCMSQNKMSSNATVIRHQRCHSSYKSLYRSQWSYSDELTSQGEEWINYLAIACTSTGKLFSVRASESCGAHLMHAVTGDKLLLSNDISDFNSIQLMI